MVLANLLMYKEIKWNRWWPCAILFYSAIENNNIEIWKILAVMQRERMRLETKAATTKAHWKYI